MFPYDDFVQYWAAARLNLLGLNPYDAEAMLAVQRAAGFGGDTPIMMYNPPTALVLAYPFAWLDWPQARLAAFVVQAAVIVFCAQRLGRVYGPDRAAGERGVFAALLFVPVWIALRMGQFSVFQFAGVAALAGLARHSPLRTGCILALLILKPPLAANLAVLLLLWTWQVRAYGLLAIAALTGLVATAVAMASNPAVLGQYFSMVALDPPRQFVSPTVGSIARAWLVPGNLWVQFLPSVAGMLWTIWYWRRHRHHWIWSEHLLLPLFVACLTAGYGGWPLDLIVLVPAVVASATRLSALSSSRKRIVVAGYATVQVVLFALHQPSTPQWTFVWLTPVLLVLFLAAVPGRQAAVPA